MSWRGYAGIQNPDTAKSICDAAGGHAVMAEAPVTIAAARASCWRPAHAPRAAAPTRHELSRALIRPDELLQDVRTDGAFLLARNAKPHVAELRPVEVVRASAAQ